MASVNDILYKEGTETKTYRFKDMSPTAVFQIPMPNSSVSTLRDELKRIRAENPKLYEAFRTGKFD